MATQKQFQNESLNLQLTIEPGCQIKLECQVAPAITEKAYQEAIKRVNKEVSLPGFRKGKAPAAMLQQKFARAIDEEFRDLVVQTTFGSAIKLSNIWPLNNSSVRAPKIGHIERTQGAQLTYQFEGQPDVPTIDINTLVIPELTPETVSDERVAQAIDELKDIYADWAEVTGRAVQMEDRVTLDIYKVDGDTQETFAEDMPIEVKKGKMANWMQKLLIGKNVGDSVEGRSEYEKENTTISEDEFKAITVKLVVKKIDEATRAGSDEELAAKMNQPSVEEMYSKLRKDLERRSQSEALERAINELKDQLLSSHAFELPASLIAMKTATRMHNIIAAMKDEGFGDDNIKEQQAMLAAQVAQEADSCLRLFFLTRPIAEALKIDINKDELLREFSAQMYSVPVSDRIIHDGLEPESIRSLLYFDLLSHKTLYYLVKQHRKGS